MIPPCAIRCIQFSIDASDRLVAVNTDWDKFAAANDAEKLTGEQVVGRTLWSQIVDEATRTIYRLIIDRVREGRRFCFRYRCDSP